MDNVIYAAVYFAVTLGAFLIGKYVCPNIPKTVTDKLGELSEWAAKFVEWAKEFKKDKTGEEKMAAVVEQLKKIADEAGLNVTEDQLKAIAQAAYNAMKAGEKESNTAEPLEALTATPAATVVINTTAPVTNNRESGYCHRQCARGCHGNQRRRHSEPLRRSREHYRERDKGRSREDGGRSHEDC